MVARTVGLPNGSLRILSERRIQRRLNVWFGACVTAQPAFAGTSALFAWVIARTIWVCRNAGYTGSASLPRQPITAGAECVCVAEMHMFSTGIPVGFAAIS